jgi:hypothetical protein
LQNQNSSIELISGARLANCLSSVLSEMESSSIPARLLGPYDYTLSPSGTPRLRNPAIAPGSTEASLFDNTSKLASLLEPLIPVTPASTQLLQILRNPGASAFDLLRHTRDFERQLADVQDVHVRSEEIEAAQKMIRARIIRRWTIAVSSVAALLFSVIATWVVYDRLFLDLPGKLGDDEILVPAGRLTLPDSTNNVPAFHLDRHEVTIGQYEQFLAAMGSEPNWKTFLPPSTPSGKSILSDLEPAGWKDILTRARKGDKYNSQIRITRDTPVFSVDYPSAYAYAKWKKRRLPSSDEWLRAASGNDMRPYPWGTDSQAPGINLGIRIQKNTPLESYSHMLPAESNPADIGPFQHFDLGGNLSEWIDSTNPINPSFIGGNFQDTFPVSNLKATRTAPTSAGYPFIGFRTAR